MTSKLQAIKTEIEILDVTQATRSQQLLPALLRIAEELESTLKVAEDALEFYKGSWHYDMIGTGEQGSTMSLWEPDRELLDDGGQRATAALAEIRVTPPLSGGIPESH